MSDEDEDMVRFNFRCRRQLRDDAKRTAERGELAEEGRQMLRRIAYGVAGEHDTELARTKAELENVRGRLDDLRRERREINAKIETVESRAVRLEERIGTLEAQQDELETKVQMLENMLTNGERMWPTRIKNAADVSADTATELFHRLQERNPDLPDAAFREPGLHEPANWKAATEGEDR